MYEIKYLYICTFTYIKTWIPLFLKYSLPRLFLNNVSSAAAERHKGYAP